MIGRRPNIRPEWSIAFNLSVNYKRLQISRRLYTTAALVMAWRCSGKTNRELVQNLMKAKILNSSEGQLERISHVCRFQDARRQWI
jgi:hypothetical protein